jgi:hypothetical protein
MKIHLYIERQYVATWALSCIFLFVSSTTSVAFCFDISLINFRIPSANSMWHRINIQWVMMTNSFDWKFSILKTIFIGTNEPANNSFQLKKSLNGIVFNILWHFCWRKYISLSKLFSVWKTKANTIGDYNSTQSLFVFDKLKCFNHSTSKSHPDTDTYSDFHALFSKLWVAWISMWLSGYSRLNFKHEVHFCGDLQLIYGMKVSEQMFCIYFRKINYQRTARLIPPSDSSTPRTIKILKNMFLWDLQTIAVTKVQKTNKREERREKTRNMKFETNSTRFSISTSL